MQEHFASWRFPCFLFRRNCNSRYLNLKLRVKLPPISRFLDFDCERKRLIFMPRNFLAIKYLKYLLILSALFVVFPLPTVRTAGGTSTVIRRRFKVRNKFREVLPRKRPLELILDHERRPVLKKPKQRKPNSPAFLVTPPDLHRTGERVVVEE